MDGFLKRHAGGGGGPGGPGGLNFDASPLLLARAVWTAASELPAAMGLVGGGASVRPSELPASAVGLSGGGPSVAQAS